jgi:hypothetical protein
MIVEAKHPVQGTRPLRIMVAWTSVREIAGVDRLTSRDPGFAAESGVPRAAQ